MSLDFETVVEQEAKRLQVIHPTPEEIPGCIKLLDDFLSCHALGTQLKSLYRYGGTSQCGRKLEDFKFCMSLKSMDPEEKREAWIRRRAEWWATRRLAKSSEDVWDIRNVPITNYPPEHRIAEVLSRPNGGQREIS